MDWQNITFGSIERDGLLNALLAIWQTRQNMKHRNCLDELSEAHERGFEEGLDVIAQIVGLSEAFEAGKSAHQAKTREKSSISTRIIDGY